MAPAQREPKVVVLGGGSWGTTVASICARRGPTLQWVRSEDTAKDINDNHRNSRYLGDEVTLDGDPQAREFTATFTRQERAVAVLLVGRPQMLPQARELLSATTELAFA